MKVFVTGGSGYVGGPIVDALLNAGHHVRCIVRDGNRPIKDERIELVKGDITDANSLNGIMRDCDALIHLVGIIKENKRRGITMERIHVEGTRNVIEEAKRAGVKHILHMSALGARENAISSYHQSKWKGERVVVDSGIPYTIFRPSVIFGKGGLGPNFVAQLMDLVRMAPLVPVIGDGAFMLQPVSVANVAQGFVKALEVEQAMNNIYEVGGPEQISYLNILTKISNAMNKKLRTVTVPVKLMQFIIPIMQNVPQFPITKDQLQMLLEGNVCEESKQFFEQLLIVPQPFIVNVSDYR